MAAGQERLGHLLKFGPSKLAIASHWRALAAAFRPKSIQLVLDVPQTIWRVFD